MTEEIVYNLEYFAKGGELHMRDSAEFIRDVVLKIIGEHDFYKMAYERMARGINDAVTGYVAQRADDEVVDQFIINGGDLTYLSPDQLRWVDDEVFLERIKNGYGFGEQITNVEFYGTDKNRFVLSGELLNESLKLGLDQIPNSTKGREHNELIPEEVPNDVLISYIRNGGNLARVPYEYRRGRSSIGPEVNWEQSETPFSAEDLNANARRTRSLELWDEQEIELLTPETIALRAVAGLGLLTGGNFLTDEQKSLIPKEVSVLPKAAYKALEDYKKGAIGIDDLPSEVFINPDARYEVILHARERAKQAFLSICEKKGYKDEVPNELVQELQNKINNLETQVYKRMREAIKEFIFDRNANKEL